MAKPHTKKYPKDFKLGKANHFHLEGTDFDTATQVALDEIGLPEIQWHPNPVPEGKLKKPSATVLEFEATPTKKDPPSHSSGVLKITVTNREGPDDNPPRPKSTYT